MIVALIWSLPKLLISTPCILGDEEPHKTEALIDRFRTQWQATCSEPTYLLLSTWVNGSLVAPLFDFIPTSDQGLGSIYSYGEWQVACALLSSNLEGVPISLGKIYTHPPSCNWQQLNRRGCLHKTSGKYYNGWLCWVEHELLEQPEWTEARWRTLVLRACFCLIQMPIGSVAGHLARSTWTYSQITVSTK